MLEWLGMRSWLFRALLALALLSCLPWKAAQAEAPGTAVASLTAVDANNFPRMFAYASVTGADGIPVNGLNESAFTLTENGEAVSATAVRSVTLGVQTVFAFDVGASFKARDVLGWNPRHPDLKTIVQHAWNWHRAHPRGYGRQ